MLAFNGSEQMIQCLNDKVNEEFDESQPDNTMQSSKYKTAKFVAFCCKVYPSQDESDSSSAQVTEEKVFLFLFHQAMRRRHLSGNIIAPSAKRT